MIKKSLIKQVIEEACLHIMDDCSETEAAEIADRVTDKLEFDHDVDLEDDEDEDEDSLDDRD